MEDPGGAAKVAAQGLGYGLLAGLNFLNRVYAGDQGFGQENMGKEFRPIF